MFFELVSCWVCFALSQKPSFNYFIKVQVPDQKLQPLGKLLLEMLCSLPVFWRNAFTNLQRFIVRHFFLSFSDLKESKALHEMMYLVLISGNFLNAVSRIFKKFV